MIALRRPLPWLTVSIAFGILLAGFSGSSELVCISVLLGITVLFAALAAKSKLSLWFLLTLLSLAAALGFLRYRAQVTISPNNVSLLAPADVELTGAINSDVQDVYSSSNARTRRVRFTLQAETAEIGDGDRQVVSGEVAVSVPIVAENGSNSDVEYSRNSPHFGDRVWLAGHLELPGGLRNPGGFDEQTTLARRGIYSRLTVTLPNNWRIEEVSGSNAGLIKPIFSLKASILSHGRRALSSERAGVLNAILLGSKSELSPADRALFEKTGTVHLLATAGLHIGLVVIGLLNLFPFLGLRRQHVVILTLGCLAVFTIMAGDRPAVVRAVIMASVYLVGMLLEREPDLHNAIALAGLGLLLANPFNLFDPGFQISFATVITLVPGMPLNQTFRRKLLARMNRKTTAGNLKWIAANYFITCLIVTAVAQIGCMPLIIYYFNIVTPAGPLANLLIVPIVWLVMALGFAAAALGAISPILALPLDWILNGLTAYILGVVRICSGPQFGVAFIGSPPVWAVICYYATLWGGLSWLRLWNKRRGARE